MKVRFLEEAVPLKNCPNALLSMFHKINRMKIQDKRLEDRKLSVIGHGKSLNPLYSTYMTDGREGKFFYTETLTVFSFSYAVKDSTNHASALNGVAVLNSGTGHLKSIFNFGVVTNLDGEICFGRKVKKGELNFFRCFSHTSFPSFEKTSTSILKVFLLT